MEKIWELLKIEPTEDVRVIKKAYAKEVKNCHQEDEPERWKELYEAYQEALAYAQNDHQSVIEPYDEEIYMPGVEQTQSETEKPTNEYTELFEGLETMEWKKQRYMAMFPDVEKVRFDYQADAWKVLFLRVDIECCFTDEAFWQALSEYLEQEKVSDFACAYLYEWFRDLEVDAFEEEVRIAIQKQKEVCWEKVRKHGFLRPKKPVKHPLKYVKRVTLMSGIFIWGILLIGGAWFLIDFIRGVIGR